MADSKEKFEKGYADGRKEADFKQNSTWLDEKVRNTGFSPRKSDDPAYNGGFDKGLEDGKDGGDSGK
jgi:hypothetical protein